MSASTLSLRAGPLSLQFLLTDATVRDVRWGAAEVLRGITAPVRDATWGTVPAEVRVVALVNGPEAFELRFAVTCRAMEIHFEWEGRLAGAADGTLRYELEGQAGSSFLKNRIGLCVLHGAQSAGTRWVVEHRDSRRTEGCFPIDISPHQPAMEIRAIAHEFAPGSWARVQFEGDVWEMEDQRNWTDASFKTYCTPLAEPFPVRMQLGDRVRQRLVLSLDVPAGSSIEVAETVCVPTLRVSREPVEIPSIGLRWSPSRCEPLLPAQLAAFAELRPDYLRIDLDPRDASIQSAARAGIELARAGTLPVELALHVDESWPLEVVRPLRELLSDSGAVSVQRWLAFGRNRPVLTDEAMVASLRDALRELAKDVPFVLGSDQNFTELNRQRPALGSHDGVCFAANPQMHAFDDLSVMETLEMLTLMARQARRLAGGFVPVHVSKLTLRPDRGMRAVGTSGCHPDDDPRRHTSFGAAWTLGAWAALTRAEAKSVTTFDVTGAHGVLAESGGVEVTRSPLFQLLAAWRALAARPGLRVATTAPGVADAVAVSTPSGVTLLAANFTDRVQRVSIEGLGEIESCRSLTEAGEAQLDPHAPRRGGVGHTLPLRRHEVVEVRAKSQVAL